MLESSTVLSTIQCFGHCSQVHAALKTPEVVAASAAHSVHNLPTAIMSLTHVFWVRQAREAAAKNTSEAVVIDVTKYGLSKVLGKGQLPAQPVVVRARFVSKLAERKIREVGGAVQLIA